MYLNKQLFGTFLVIRWIKRSIFTCVEGLNVINGPKCNKVLNVITFCPKCNKVLGYSNTGKKFSIA